MALFRATSNPQATLKLEAAHRKLNSILLGDGPVDKAKELLTLRRGAIREAVIEVLVQADDALAPLEIRRRAASRLGRSVNRSTIDSCLMKVVADPTVPIARVGPARYAVADGAELSQSGREMGAVRERVLAVLGTGSGAMRPADVWSAIEARHGKAMSYDAVASFLSLAAKRCDLPVERVRRGWYRLASG